MLFEWFSGVIVWSDFLKYARKIFAIKKSSTPQVKAINQTQLNISLSVYFLNSICFSLISLKILNFVQENLFETKSQSNIFQQQKQTIFMKTILAFSSITANECSKEEKFVCKTHAKRNQMKNLSLLKFIELMLARLLTEQKICLNLLQVTLCLLYLLCLELSRQLLECSSQKLERNSKNSRAVQCRRKCTMWDILSSWFKYFKM